MITTKLQDAYLMSKSHSLFIYTKNEQMEFEVKNNIVYFSPAE